jgi:uncharacterized protein (DUF433 family)
VILPIVLVPHPHVRVDVSGSRVPVRRLWVFFRDGARVETLMRRYPKLGPAKVLDALAFALDNPEVIEADIARENQLLQRAGRTAVGVQPRAEQIELPFDVAPASARARQGG